MGALMESGDIITWGDYPTYLTSYSVDGVQQTKMAIPAGKKVKSVHSNQEAFVAILDVDTDEMLAPDDTNNVESNNLESNVTNATTKTLPKNGGVVTWGTNRAGANVTQATLDKLVGKDIVDIKGSGFAFAALLADGSIVTWGSSMNGGDSSSIQAALAESPAKSIFSPSALRTTNGFAAILQDGSVVAWGRAFGEKQSE